MRAQLEFASVAAFAFSISVAPSVFIAPVLAAEVSLLDAAESGDHAAALTTPGVGTPTNGTTTKDKSLWK